MPELYNVNNTEHYRMHHSRGVRSLVQCSVLFQGHERRNLIPVQRYLGYLIK